MGEVPRNVVTLSRPRASRRGDRECPFPLGSWDSFAAAIKALNEGSCSPSRPVIVKMINRHLGVRETYALNYFFWLLLPAVHQRFRKHYLRTRGHLVHRAGLGRGERQRLQAKKATGTK